MKNHILRESDVKTKSDLMRYIRDVKGSSNADMAFRTGTSTAYFNNKLSRNSFSIEDLATVCYSFDLKLIIESNDDGRVIFDATRVFADKTIRDKVYNIEYQKYMKLKASIEEMENKYPHLKETPQ